MFDRNKDPNNLEELMIREYIRIQGQNDHFLDELDKMHYKMEDQYAEMMDLLQAEEAKSAHLQSIIDKDNGIVDLHESLLMYKSTVASSLYFRQYLESNPDDIDEFEKAIFFNDAECVNFFKECTSGYTRLCSISQYTFTFTIQVPVFGKLAYSPEKDEHELISVNTAYNDKQWCHIPLEEFYHGTAGIIREEARIALKEYKHELAKAKVEEAES